MFDGIPLLVAYTQGEEPTGRDMDTASPQPPTPPSPQEREHMSQDDTTTHAPPAPERPEAWLRILEQVTVGALAHLDLQALLKEVLGRVCKAMRVDNAAILLRSEDGQDLLVYSAHGPEEQVEGKVRVPFGRGVAGTIAARGEPMIIDDLSRVEVENPVLRAEVKSLVGVPIFADGKVIGVMHVDSASPRHFTDDDSRLLQVIASRVALAIEHARLYQAEREATRKLRALQEVSDVALAYARLDTLLRALLERIQQTMTVDNVAILLPTTDGKALSLYSVQGPEEAVMGRVRVPIGEGVAGTIAARREPLYVENLASVPVSNPFLKEHFRSLLGVPLLSGDRLIGVLHVDSIEPRAFSEDDLALLQVIAERIAMAIDRARELQTAEETRAEAESQVAALREITHRMDAFLGIASHELRTPVTSLTTNLQLLDYWLLSQRGRRAGETENEYLTRAVASSQPLVRRATTSVARLNRLIEDLLDASRIQKQHLDLDIAPVEIGAVVREIVEEERQARPERTITIEPPALERPSVADPPPPPVLVHADAHRIGQVLTNFLGNAIKYSPPAAPVTVGVESEPDLGHARVWVRDHGVGIPSEEHTNIWERFYRVPGIGHQSGSQVGLGLGLYICRDIIQRHGGTIGVISAPGDGSTFWFTLPLASHEHAATPAGAP